MRDEMRNGLLLGDVMGRCSMGRVWDVEETPSPDETEDEKVLCVGCGCKIEDVENSGDLCEACYQKEAREELYGYRHPDEY